FARGTQGLQSLREPRPGVARRGSTQRSPKAKRISRPRATDYSTASRSRGVLQLALYQVRFGQEDFPHRRFAARPFLLLRREGHGHPELPALRKIPASLLSPR